MDCFQYAQPHSLTCNSLFLLQICTCRPNEYMTYSFSRFRTFIVCLSSGLLGAVIIFSVNLMQFIAYFTDADTGNILLPYACKWITDMPCIVVSVICLCCSDQRYASSIDSFAKIGKPLLGHKVVITWPKVLSVYCSLRLFVEHP